MFIAFCVCGIHGRLIRREYWQTQSTRTLPSSSLSQAFHLKTKTFYFQMEILIFKSYFQKNCAKGKGDEYFRQGQYESAMSIYLLMLQKLRMYPIYPDEILLNDEKESDDLRINILKNISLIYFKTMQWNQCIDLCNLILSKRPTDKKSLHRKAIASQNISKDAHANNEVKHVPSHSDSTSSSSSKKLFECVRIPFKGKGLLAHQNIDKYTIIIDECPIFQYSNTDINDQQILFDEFMQLSLSDRNIVASMDHSVLFDDEYEYEMNKDKLFDIIERNNIEVIEDESNALFPTITKINHSCSPNAIWFWDAASETQKVISIDNIKRGDELTVSYCQPGYSRKLRRKYLLQHFGFYCQCKRCNTIDPDEIAFYDKISSIHCKFMCRLEGYVWNKRADKITKMLQLADEYFPYMTITLEHILNKVHSHDAALVDVLRSTTFHQLTVLCYRSKFLSKKG